MPRLSLAQQLREVEEALAGPERYLDQALALRRAKDRSTLLWAGGRWDRLERRYLEHEEPEKVCVLDLEESQVEFALWFAGWLADYRDGYPRDISAALIAGDRRAGKTFGAYACQLTAIVDVPLQPSGMPTIGWTISRTYKEREELDELIINRLPAAWYRHQKAPEHAFLFHTGAVLRNLSADDPDALKRGRGDIVLFNEGQKIDGRAVNHALFGTVDGGGLTLITANPPSQHDTRGEWLFDVQDAIEEEQRSRIKQGAEPLGIRYFGMTSKQNTKIDQPARRRVARLAAIIDPSMVASDDQGIWKRPGERALWEFDKGRHLQLVPKIGARDITAQVAGAASWGEWVAVGGGDFQGRPHIIAALIRAFGDIDDPILWVFGEHVEERATEEQFLESFEAGPARRYGLTRSNLLWICDASGAWQNARHEGERSSFEIWKDDDWTIIPPQEPKARRERSGRPSPGGEQRRARNPAVMDRLTLCNERFRRDRFFIDPKGAPHLAECAREATTKREAGATRRLVGNIFSHGIDAMTYPAYRLLGGADGSRSGSHDTAGYGPTDHQRRGSPFDRK